MNWGRPSEESSAEFAGNSIDTPAILVNDPIAARQLENSGDVRTPFNIRQTFDNILRIRQSLPLEMWGGIVECAETTTRRSP